MWLVDLPGSTENAVIGLAVGVVLILVKLVSVYLPWLKSFLEQFAQEWGMALGLAVVALLEQYLPGGEWTEVSNLGVLLMVTVVTVLLAKAGLVRARVRPFYKE